MDGMMDEEEKWQKCGPTAGVERWQHIRLLCKNWAAKKKNSKEEKKILKFAQIIAYIRKSKDVITVHSE